MGTLWTDVAKTRARSESGSRTAAKASADKQPKIAPQWHMPNRRDASRSRERNLQQLDHRTLQRATQRNQPESSDPSSIAQEVAKLLIPTIKAVVEKAVTQGIHQLCQEVVEQAQRLLGREQRIADIENNVTCLLAVIDKVEDLDNRSRNNNYYNEDYRSAGILPQLQYLYTKIPRNLGLRQPCVLERGHRIGPPNVERASPRPVIVRYLNYADKALLLKAYRKQGELQYMWMDINCLCSRSSSAEVSRKRKAFAQVFSTLYQKRLKFTLAYPAVLYVLSKSRKNKTFHTPIEAEQFLKKYKSPPTPRVRVHLLEWIPLRQREKSAFPGHQRKAKRHVIYVIDV